MKRRGISIESDATLANALVLQVWMQAIDGDPKAAKEVRESIEGKAGQRPADPGDNEPVKTRVVYAHENRDCLPKPDSVADLGPDQDKGTK